MRSYCNSSTHRMGRRSEAEINKVFDALYNFNLKRYAELIEKEEIQRLVRHFFDNVDTSDWSLDNQIGRDMILRDLHLQ